MAVIEISRIQVRRGQEKQTGIPVLAGGEFGWAEDTERLYIGLRREDGGSRDANVEVLTENHLRNFFTTLTTTATYTYQVGSDITSMDGGNTETTRTIQSKLDDVVSVADFGIVGGSDDNTAALRIAVENLFLDPLQPTPLYGSTAKVLHIPAGVYNISDTIFVPKNTVIIGAGIDRTIINQLSTGSHVFQTIDSTSIGSALGGENGYVTFDNTSTINSLYQPNNVYLEGMTLQFDASTAVAGALSLISLDCANHAVVKNIRFKGHHTYADAVNVNYVGVDIRGYQQATSSNVLIENCEFDQLYHCIKSNYDIVNPVIVNSEFSNSHRGITFNDPKDSTASIGPRFARIENNRFSGIEAEAIYAGASATNTVTNHISANNQFVDVGNSNPSWGEQSSTGTAVITYISAGNVSTNDYFGRADFQRRNATSNYVFNPLIAGRATINSAAGDTVTVLGLLSAYVMRVPITQQPQFLTMKYSAGDRKGLLKINIGAGSNPSTSITDDYDYITDSGNLDWTTTISASSKFIELRVYNGSSSAITLEYQSNLML